MSVTPSPIGGFAAQFFDNNGVILSGGKIYTYAAGTTTPQASYTSAAGVTPHTNPIILDSAGRVPGGEIWLTDGLIYKFVIETALSVLIGTYDNITGVNSNFVNYTVQEEVITATAGQTVFNLSTINYTPGTNSLSVYIDGVNQYVGDSYLETDSDTVTFTSGVHVGGEVKFTTAVQTTTGAIDASAVGYTANFTGATAQTVQTKLEQYVSVKDFGAVSGDIGNQASAIQAAIDAASSAGGGWVYLPAGVFRTTSTINLKSNVTLTGPGVIHSFGATGTSAFEAIGTLGTPLENIHVIGVTVRGDATFSGGVPSVLNRSAFDFRFCNFSSVQGSKITGFADNAVAFANGDFNVIDGNYGENCGQTFSFYATTRDSYGNRNTNNRVKNNGTYNAIHNEGLASGGLGKLYLQTVSGNTVKGSYGNCYNVENCPEAVVEGNRAENAGPGTAPETIHGIFLFGSPGSTVTGNVCTDNDGFGIHLSANCGNCVVNGNTTLRNTLGSFKLSDGGGVSASTNVAVNINRFTEGAITTTANTSVLGLLLGNQADANPLALDWYQEGTFTPVVVGSSTPGAATYTTQTGEYQRIGNRVFFSLVVAWSAHTGTGDLAPITGLPFASANISQPPLTIYNNGYAVSSGTIQGFVTANASTVTINQVTATTGVAAALALDTVVSDLRICGFYRVA